jgi:uncharacterized surface protein with fasciclin (FAS1) repeats
VDAESDPAVATKTVSLQSGDFVHLELPFNPAGRHLVKRQRISAVDSAHHCDRGLSSDHSAEDASLKGSEASPKWEDRLRDSPPPTEIHDLVETAQRQGSFTTLLEFARSAKVLEELSGPGPFTILAPTDSAFATLSEDVRKELRQNPKLLKRLLLYHAISGRFRVNASENEGRPKTVLGPTVHWTMHDDSIQINSARVIGSPVSCTDGLLYTIDRVLIPPGFPVPSADTRSDDSTDEDQ